MIIHSTTLNTEAKVIEIYGGTSWIQHSGYVLRGALNGVTSNDAQKTGGSDDAIVPYHNHSVDRALLAESSGSHTHRFFADASGVYLLKDGGNAGISNVTGYKNTPSMFTGTQNAGDHQHYISAHDTNYAGTNGNTINANVPNYKSVYIWERVS